MHVLITGGLGFLGLNVAKQLTRKGCEIFLYDRRPVKENERGNQSLDSLLNSQNILFIEGDITDAAGFSGIIQRYHIDIVVHLATILTEECANKPVEAARVNCMGSAIVFEACKYEGVNRVVYGSSVAAYGDSPELPTGEERLLNPPSVYGASKAFVEYTARAMMKSDPALDLLGLRFGWIYGEGRVRGWNDLQRLIEGFALEHPIVPYPNYSASNDWTYIDDAANAVVLCIFANKASVPVYNVSGDYRSVQDAVCYLQTKFPNTSAQPYQSKLSPNAWNFTSDRILHEVGFEAKIKLEKGLDLTVNAIRQEHGLPAV